jgi:uncharacterized protein (TIGR01777 family)
MEKKSTVLITGGTGLIGTQLSNLLVQRGYSVIILSRGLPAQNRRTTGVEYAQWDINQQKIDESAIKKTDHIIHLAGANIGDKRWSKKRKLEIVESRVQPSALLVKVLREIPNRVQSVISASAIGWYGEDQQGGEAFIESDPAAPGFLGETCKAWEESIDPVTQLGKRLVKIRTGIVLSNDGGAFPEFKRPVKFGFAAILGNGKQKISWIHIADLCALYCFALENEELRNAINGVSPHPISNKSFTIQLAKKMKGNFYVPVYIPAFALKLVLGEMSIEVLKGTSVSNQKIRQAGFRYTFPTIESALGDLVKPS